MGVMVMTTEIEKLLDKYRNWLAEKTTFRRIDEWVEITTPYLDRHNDCLQIYVKQENGRFLLSDDGYIIQDLLQSGCKLDSKKRKDLLQMTLNGFGVKSKNDILTTYATANDFAIKKHNFIQAMLSVNDLFYLVSPSPVVKSLFLEDVASWLDLHEIRCVAKVIFTGVTGYNHVFDFVIPKSKTKAERMIRTINSPSRETAESIVFAWVDTKKAREADSYPYAILNNNTEKTVSSKISAALESYDIQPILWTERENYLEELAA